MSAFHRRLVDAMQARATPGNLAAEIAKNGSMELEFYAPTVTDPQQPHDRDELYIIARGHGILRVENTEFRFQAGDVLFVPARAAHRFTTFGSDFATWVVFYGPKGGESKAP